MTSYGAVLYTSKVTDNNIGAIDLTTPPVTDLSYTAIYWCSQTIHNLEATPHSIVAGALTAYERLVHNGRFTDNIHNLEYFATYTAPSTGALQYRFERR